MNLLNEDVFQSIDVIVYYMILDGCRTSADGACEKRMCTVSVRTFRGGQTLGFGVVRMVARHLACGMYRHGNTFCIQMSDGPFGGGLLFLDTGYNISFRHDLPACRILRIVCPCHGKDY